MAWFLLLLIAIAFTAVGYILTPKPKIAKPDAAQDLDNPVAEAGKPVGVVQGDITITGLNVLWFGEKAMTTYNVSTG